ncbi:hypothetical protein M8C21_020456 [Ambrosia artemisiifolia]|uniref:Lactoylglutathione lyase n=1 Tax=Ambrosia artemisiifolia TaxID=4212 RepID=A0AAD5BXI4_AMBAR|nr:hypothetical protein M8C21_020456 [Ambrosia artemisiifolia]
MKNRNKFATPKKNPNPTLSQHSSSRPFTAAPRPFAAVHRRLGSLKPWILQKPRVRGKVTSQPSPAKAFIEDPDGYTFELIQRKGRISQPLCQVMLRVGDIDRPINFYQQEYGMKLLRKSDEPENKAY